MAFILNIETATTVCSVAISNQSGVIAFNETDNGYTHAENLHVFIKNTLEKAKIEAKELDAIAISRGPGSYTGLRIGTSAAKGMAYALGIPLISVDTLAVMTVAAMKQLPGASQYCPMLDARRMEVYTCGYNRSMEIINPTEALVVDAQTILKYETAFTCFFGNGMDKCRALLEKLDGSAFIEHIKPSATNMWELSLGKFTSGQFEDVAYFEPYYLKDFLIVSKKSGT